MNILHTESEEKYWSQRYNQQQTGWDIGHPSTPLKAYIDQLTDKNMRILIPGAGNAYEAEYLYALGFHNVFVLDISEAPLLAFAERMPEFPKDQLLHQNFFEHQASYDLILEQTFFCSFVPTPENRQQYAQKMMELLNPQGKLVGVWFDIALTGDMEKRPFGGTKAEYLTYLTPYFEVEVFETCYNSIKPRSGTELFGIFRNSATLHQKQLLHWLE